MEPVIARPASCPPIITTKKSQKPILVPKPIIPSPFYPLPVPSPLNYLPFSIPSISPISSGGSSSGPSSPQLGNHASLDQELAMLRRLQGEDYIPDRYLPSPFKKKAKNKFYVGTPEEVLSQRKRDLFFHMCKCQSTQTSANPTLSS